MVIQVSEGMSLGTIQSILNQGIEAEMQGIGLDNVPSIKMGDLVIRMTATTLSSKPRESTAERFFDFGSGKRTEFRFDYSFRREFHSVSNEEIAIVFTNHLLADMLALMLFTAHYGRSKSGPNQFVEVHCHSGAHTSVSRGGGSWTRTYTTLLPLVKSIADPEGYEWYVQHFSMGGVISPMGAAPTWIEHCIVSDPWGSWKDRVLHTSASAEFIDTVNRLSSTTAWWY